MKKDRKIELDFTKPKWTKYEVAHYRRVHPNTVVRWAKLGLIPRGEHLHPQKLDKVLFDRVALFAAFEALDARHGPRAKDTSDTTD